MISWDRVTELRSEIGAGGFAEVLDLFLEEVEQVIARLGKDRTHLVEDLHFLKGSALNLGFRDLGALCQDGERRCNAGETDTLDVSPIIQCYGQSKAIFMERVGEFIDAA